MLLVGLEPSSALVAAVLLPEILAAGAAPSAAVAADLQLSQLQYHYDRLMGVRRRGAFLAVHVLTGSLNAAFSSDPSEHQ